MSIPEPVTVGIPAYNAEPFLARAVASVRAQRWPIAEILVVDDGSTDGTTNLARALGCRVLALRKNRGEPAARNALLASAVTPLVAWLDADDEWLPHHLETVMPAMAQSSRAAAFGLIRYIPLGGAWPLPPESVAGPALLSAALHRALVPHNAVVVRVEHILKVGGYREHLRLACDFDLWCRLAGHYDLFGIDEVTALVHMHALQSSRKGMAYHEMEYKLRREYLESPGSRERFGVSAEWLREANYEVWCAHLATTWHTRDVRTRLWHLSQYRGHGRPLAFLRALLGSALIPVATAADRLRASASQRPQDDRA